MSAASWSCALVIGSRPMPLNIRSKPRPRPDANRPPLRRCIVVANVAVTIGWRVLWFVAAVAMPRLSVTAATAPQSVDGVLEVEALRHERRAEPERLGLARPRRGDRAASRCGPPACRSPARPVAPSFDVLLSQPRSGGRHRFPATRHSRDRARRGPPACGRRAATATTVRPPPSGRSAVPAPVAPHRRP